MTRVPKFICVEPKLRGRVQTLNPEWNGFVSSKVTTDTVFSVEQGIKVPHVCERGVLHLKPEHVGELSSLFGTFLDKCSGRSLKESLNWLATKLTGETRGK